VKPTSSIALADMALVPWRIASRSFFFRRTIKQASTMPEGERVPIRRPQVVSTKGVGIVLSIPGRKRWIFEMLSF